MVKVLCASSCGSNLKMTLDEQLVLLNSIQMKAIYII